MLKREAALNIDPNADVSSYDRLLERYDSGELDPIGTNWWKETFKSHGTETAHTIQVNGGSANTTYMMSLGYLYQGGLLDQTNYNRYNGRMNMESQLKPWISLGGQISFYRGVKKDGYAGFSSIVQHVNRQNATTSVYLDNGEFAYPGNMQNPVAEIDNRTGIYRRTDDQLFANVYTNITPIKGLSIRPLFSWRHDYAEQYAYKKTLYYDGTWNNSDNGQRSGYRYFYRWDWMTYQLVANYNKTFAEKHNLALLAGYESQHYITRTSKMTRTGGGDNALDDVLNSLSQTGMSNSDESSALNRRSWFGRVQYDFMGKYLFEANLRADASSRFPKDSRWGYFPAMSAAWRISEEGFMDSTRGWLNQLKLRLGWGRTGNEELDEFYPAVATYAYSSDLMIGNALYSALYESRYVNNKLKWANVTNWELGVEAAFFNNRLTFEGSLYKRTTNDMLLNLPILEILGVDAPAQNAGSVENKGVDITIGYRTQFNKDWGFHASFNMGYNHNEITNLEGTEGQKPGDSTIWYLEGYAINSYYGYVCDGIFKDEAEVKAGPLRTGNEKPGNLRFKDLNGDGRITADEDRTVIGKVAPTWMGGINLGATFRDFDLSMLWQGAFDYERYMTGEATQAFYNNGTVNKWQMRERWSPENPNGTYPRLYTNSSGSPDVDVVNSFWCQDASYVRLKNLTFGYNIPTFITEKIGVNKIRVYFNGENLLTFSKIFKKDIDPEAPAGRGAYYANVRKYSLGLKVTF